MPPGFFAGEAPRFAITFHAPHLPGHKVLSELCKTVARHTARQLEEPALSRIFAPVRLLSKPRHRVVAGGPGCEAT